MRFDYSKADCKNCTGLDLSTQGKLLAYCKIRQERVLPNFNQASECVGEGLFEEEISKTLNQKCKK